MPLIRKGIVIIMKKIIVFLIALSLVLGNAVFADASGRTVFCYDFDSITMSGESTEENNGELFIRGHIDEFDINISHDNMAPKQLGYCSGGYGMYGRYYGDGSLRVVYNEAAAKYKWPASYFTAALSAEVKKGEKLCFSVDIAALNESGDISAKLMGTADNGNVYKPVFRQLYPQEQDSWHDCTNLFLKSNGWFYCVWDLGGPKFVPEMWHRIDNIIDTQNDVYGGMQTMAFYIDGELIFLGELDADSTTEEIELIKSFNAFQLITAPNVKEENGSLNGQRAEFCTDNWTLNIIENDGKYPEYRVDGKLSGGGFKKGSIVTAKAKKANLFAEESNGAEKTYLAAESDASGDVSLRLDSAEKVRLFLWDKKMEPFGLSDTLVPYNEKVILSEDFSDFSDGTLSGRLINDGSLNELFSYAPVCGRFGKDSGDCAIYVSNNDSEVTLGGGKPQYERGIDLTPAGTYVGKNDSITISFDFAHDELNIPKCIKSAANEGLMVNIADFYQDGRVIILGRACPGLKLSKQQWYHFDIVINPDIYGSINTYSAYVNGKKYIDNAVFAAAAKIENKISGFKKLKIMYDPWDYYLQIPDGKWYAESGDKVRFKKDGFYLDNFKIATSQKCSPQFADFDVASNDAVLNMALDNGTFTAGDYGQDAEKFEQSLENGFVRKARLIAADGSRKTVLSGSGGDYLRLSTDNGYDIYYKMIEGTDSSIKEQQGIETDANPNTAGWYEYEFPDINIMTRKGNILNTAELAEHEDIASHGFIKTDGEYFTGTNDGAHVQFWGTNVIGPGCFPEHDEAEAMADMIAQQGFNLVRFHQMCGREGNVFLGSDENFKLSAAQMDKLCYFLKQLRSRGIYYFFDLGIDTFNDGSISQAIPKNPTLAAYFDETVQNIQIDYAKELLTYADPYDGGRICDNPALAAVCCVNEANSLSHTDKLKSDDSYYFDELEKLWNQYLQKQYPSALDKISYNKNLNSGESISKGTVKLGSYDDRNSYTKARVFDIHKFLNGLQESYFANIKAMMTENGIKTLMTGTTLFGMLEPQIMKSNLTTDFIDIHYYWAHPDGYSLDTGVEFKNDTGSMLKDADMGIIGKLANRKPYNTPYTISEWNTCAGSMYLAEGPMLMAAYSKLQNWNPMQFMFSARGMKNYENERISDVFANENHPIRIGTMNAAALLRQNVREANCACYADYSGADWYDYTKHSGKTTDTMYKTYDMFDGDTRNAFLHKTGISLLEKPRSTADMIDKSTDYETFTSDTGELFYNQKEAYFTADTDRSKAAAGFYGGKGIAVGNVTFKPDNEFAAIYVNSVDKNSIENSGRLLLTAAGRAVSSGQVLSRDGKKVIKQGTAPVLVEPITGTVKIKTAQNMQVYALTSSGERLRRIESSYENGVLSVTLSAEDKTMNYEIVR